MVSHSLLSVILENTSLPLQRARSIARLVGGMQLTLPDARPSSFLPVGGHGMLRGRHSHPATDRTIPVTVLAKQGLVFPSAHIGSNFVTARDVTLGSSYKSGRNLLFCF